VEGVLQRVQSMFIGIGVDEVERVCFNGLGKTSHSALRKL
jgi:hypothetical protein